MTKEDAAALGKVKSPSRKKGKMILSIIMSIISIVYVLPVLS